MLHAISSGKAGRNINSTDVNWRQLFSTSEDSLTSTIFGTMRYLPAELFWHIIQEASYNKCLPMARHKVEEFHFWPHWKKEATMQGVFVEPDIFIRTKSFDLIVEAKRYDNNQQNYAQWKNELITYLNEYGAEEKPVFLLAIGGISGEHDETMNHKDRSMPIIKCRWKRILYVIRGILNQLEKSNGIMNHVDSTIVILKDLILGFRIHGYSTGDWFETLDADKYRLVANESFTLLSSNPFPPKKALHKSSSSTIL